MRCVYAIASDSLQPHGLQSIRVLYPWKLPGQNTGVGCHFFPPGDLPDPGIKPVSCLTVDSLPLSHLVWVIMHFWGDAIYSEN